jgi:Raf kinase inhibitor-like YbhB/YbcL family protein
MRHLTSTLALVTLASTLLLGQQQGANQPAPPAPAGQRGGGGGGRGRGAIAAMTLTSTAWPDGGAIPAKYTQAGDDMSPPLAWSGAPEGVVSYVLIVHDTDAPIGNGTDDLLHWMVWNIPAAVSAFQEYPPAMQLPAPMRQISAIGPSYRGPGALASGPTHHYVFELFALDTMLDVPAVGAQPPAARTAVVTAMAGHIRGKATYVGLFKRR